MTVVVEMVSFHFLKLFLLLHQHSQLPGFLFSLAVLHLAQWLFLLMLVLNIIFRYRQRSNVWILQYLTSFLRVVLGLNVQECKLLAFSVQTNFATDPKLLMY